MLGIKDAINTTVLCIRQHGAGVSYACPLDEHQASCSCRLYSQSSGSCIH